MGSDAEREVAVRRSVEHDLIRRIEHALVPICGRPGQEHGLAGSDVLASDLYVLSCDARVRLGGRHPPQELLDRDRDEGGVLAESPSTLNIAAEMDESGAKSGARGVCSADDGREHDAPYLRV